MSRLTISPSLLNLTAIASRVDNTCTATLWVTVHQRNPHSRRTSPRQETPQTNCLCCIRLHEVKLPTKRCHPSAKNATCIPGLAGYFDKQTRSHQHVHWANASRRKTRLDRAAFVYSFVCVSERPREKERRRSDIGRTILCLIKWQR